jgi:hypothetical protein
MTISMLGWVATCVFAASYFFREASALKKIQAIAACLWIIYGFAIGAVPVVVANMIVAGAALYSSLRRPTALDGRFLVKRGSEIGYTMRQTGETKMATSNSVCILERIPCD